MAWGDLNKKGMPLARHRARLGLVLRMMISTALTYALGTALHQTQAYWAVLTAIIVTGNSVGGSLKAAIDRLVGSICGAGRRPRCGPAARPHPDHSWPRPRRRHNAARSTDRLRAALPYRTLSPRSSCC